MYTFPELIRKIRNEAGLTQPEFAKAIGVSTILISMVETGQKEVSKKLLIKIANGLDVHPLSITPFLFMNNKKELGGDFSAIEEKFIEFGEKLQNHLIKNRAKILKKHAK